jgi:hypothetical protein
MPPLMIVGHPDYVAAYLASPSGRTTARAMAEAIFADDERLAEFEMGQAEFHPVVEHELDRMIAQRNREDDA